MNELPMKEDERQEILQYEEGVIDQIKEENSLGGLEGMFAAAEEAKDEVFPIDVIRKGKKYFSFDVGPLEIKDFDRLEKANQKFEKDPKRGTNKLVDFDSQGYLTMVIFEATTPEHKKEYWSNPEVRKRYGTIGFQSVPQFLKAGEIEEIAAYIERISGRDNELRLGETIKNSSEQEEN